ncbi:MULTISPECIES: DUF805 domain-containing protein [unclassified Pseudomonas]|uniref:DUF805 domain-containing protein n=1 Tax=unclassified Pseudomonas TaxID=196821 RepID=UPI001F59F6F6|nr:MULTISPECIES: DUF805 domain-containing protein [unclassified Pseudomonas]
MNWYLDALKKSFVFEGRSSRRAFWYFQLVDKVIEGAYIAICWWFFEDWIKTTLGIGLGYLLLTLPARVTLLCRRLTDNGISQVNSFWTLLPFVGSLFWVGFGLWPGAKEQSANRSVDTSRTAA